MLHWNFRTILTVLSVFHKVGFEWMRRASDVPAMEFNVDVRSHRCAKNDNQWTGFGLPELLIVTSGYRSSVDSEINVWHCNLILWNARNKYMYRPSVRSGYEFYLDNLCVLYTVFYRAISGMGCITLAWKNLAALSSAFRSFMSLLICNTSW